MSRDKIKSGRTVAKLTVKQLKLIYSLKQKKCRREHGLFLVEGDHSVAAAVDSDWQVDKIILKASADAAKSIPAGFKGEIYSLATREFNRLADSQTPQDIMAVVKVKKPVAIAERLAGASRITVADGIADPGNLGTMIRTAAAFGFDLFVCMNDCAEIYNPKVIRATQGGLFAIPVWEADSACEFRRLLPSDFKIIAFDAESRMPLSKIPKTEKMALVFGNEVRGISDEIRKAADHLARIEQTSKVESLNVAVAAGIGMWWGMAGNL